MNISPAFCIEGRVAIVTGGAAGIGLGIVEAFDNAGVRVLAIGRRPDGAAAIARVAPHARYFAADLAVADAAARIFAAAVEAFGTVDILVNNAAQLENASVAGYTAEYIDRMTTTNIRAVLLLIKEFAAVRAKAGPGGKIINIGSLEGYVATLPAGMGVYSATKTAIRGMTVSLSRELAPLRIGVNAIAPGVITHPNLFARTEEVGLKRADLDAAMERLRTRTNAGRMGQPEDIANVCVFLASAASDYISGQTILVDGGITITGD